jgi:RsiW-degrading membrane proteinase PrsW (M82 family)
MFSNSNNAPQEQQYRYVVGKQNQGKVAWLVILSIAIFLFALYVVYNMGEKRQGYWWAVLAYIVITFILTFIAMLVLGLSASQWRAKA